MGMKAGWIAMFLFVWIIGIFLGSTYDGYDSADTWAGTGTGGYETSPYVTINKLFQEQETTQKSSFFGKLSVITSGDFWSASWQIVTWKFSFVEDYPMFYWIVCAPFAAMGILSLLVLVYGIATGNLTWS